MSTRLIIISPPEDHPSEISTIISLFRAGLKQFHIRKPKFSDFDMMCYITSIPKEFHPFLVLHSNYHLAKEFKLKGIQVRKSRTTEAQPYQNDFKYFGYSAHSLDEIVENKDTYTHFFLSPVFNSISKKGYQSNMSLTEITAFVHDHSQLKLIALGGINAQNSKQCLAAGFESIALLGAIWQHDDALSAYTEIQESLNTRSFSMSIAGFDPSSGAGVSADIKTFEQHRVQGFGVVTAITYQNESEFLAVDWLTFEQIKKQIEVIFFKHRIQYIKIGLIENFIVLKQIIALLKKLNAEVKIIWDPILKASANFGFHTTINTADVINLLKDIYLITPNLPECKEIFGTSDLIAIQSKINELAICSVLIKGGHSLSDDVEDVLIEPGNITRFKGKRLANKDKHGTGCVLSSAICSHLSNNIEFSDAIRKGKDYVTKFIDSNNSLLGFHSTVK